MLSLNSPSGARSRSAAVSNGEVSWSEALTASWAISWRSSLLTAGGLLATLTVLHRFSVHLPARSALDGATAQFLFGTVTAAVGSFLFIPKMISTPSRRFRIRIIVGQPGFGTPGSLTISRRIRVWFFLTWRLGAALSFGVFLALLLKVILLMFSLRGDAAVLGVVALVMILVVSPMLVKLLIGRQFADFRLEVERSPKAERHTP